MTLHFSKYHGAGNDFVIIDNRELAFNPSPQQVAALCHRQFGIGADGLMLLEADGEFDFRMRYFNSDGPEATMCGNGGRCLVMFARKLGLFDHQTRFVGIDGEHQAILIDKQTVKLQMIDVDSVSVEDDNYLINTGSPHLVQFVADVDHIDVAYQGKLMRNTFGQQPDGVNVNFAHFTADGIKIRTYERGVEGETLACGTGAVATAIAANHWYNEDKTRYTVYARGGTLIISFDKRGINQYSNVWLQGPVVHVFDGVISI
ncbi:MAG: diaminopimelate epimerase [Tenuifilaceae bacterium]|jgi:diaminopimelate epimerase|nr:diaminopimelate epimerase [Tenuifilaceae bacterium]